MEHNTEEGGLSSFADMVSGVSMLEQDFPFGGGFEKGTTLEGKGKEKLILQDENDKEKINDDDNINPSKDDLISPSLTTNMIEMTILDNNLLPEDVLSIITDKLDFDDLFPFGGVCHDWRESIAKFLAQFMASPVPLVIGMSTPSNGHVSFLAFPHGKSYTPKLPNELSLNVTRYANLHYLGFSTEHMIMVKRATNKFFLLNPFMRRSMMQIPELALPSNRQVKKWDHAMLAFAVGSEDEFVIVAISCTPHYRLFSYQSRNDSWMCYDTNALSENFVDVVVFHRALYAINVVGHIGVVSLNIPRVKVIQFKNVPSVRYYQLKLVVSEGQLLVVQFINSSFKKIELKIYRIDFTTMEWVKLETLGNRALFLSWDTRCHALSNPGKWGYEADHVYYVDGTAMCKVYGIDGKLIWSFSHTDGIVYGDHDKEMFTRALRGQPLFVDWCFRNLRDEVDYSLDD